MFQVILCDTDRQRYKLLALETGVRVFRCCYLQQMREVLAREHIELIIMNLELIHYDTEQLKKDLITYTGALLCIGRTPSVPGQKDIPVIAPRTDEETFVEDVFSAVLRNRLSGSASAGHDAGQIPLTGSSRAMQKVRSQIVTYAASENPVLIIGETGTGKNIVARALHDISGRSGAYHAVNCSAFSRELFDSELFGHERGSFTGAVAEKPGFFEKSDGGTLFLDEIGDLPPALQPKLLKVIEERTFYRVGGLDRLRADVRIVSATNADIPARLASGSLREDLFYRINTFTIVLPPLRERKEDIPELISSFFCREAEGVRLTSRTVDRAMERDWPGNVRQLHTFLARCLAHHPGRRSIDIPESRFSELCESFHPYKLPDKEPRT